MNEPAIDPIVEAVRAKLLSRSQTGLAKYGTTLARDDLTTLDWLNHAQQEAMDFCNYLEVLIRREEQKVNDPDCYAEPQASPTRTVRVTAHTESLMRPLEPGEELCVRNETDQKLFVTADRSFRYLDSLMGQIAELRQERDAILKLLVVKIDSKWVAHWPVMVADLGGVKMELCEQPFDSLPEAIACVRKAAGLDNETAIVPPDKPEQLQARIAELGQEWDELRKAAGLDESEVSEDDVRAAYRKLAESLGHVVVQMNESEVSE